MKIRAKKGNIEVEFDDESSSSGIAYRWNNVAMVVSAVLAIDNPSQSFKDIGVSNLNSSASGDIK